MPFYLRERDISPELAGVESVLIVPCRFCPAASLAVREQEPYIRLFRTFLKTPSYQAYIRGLESRLRQQAIRTEVFENRLPQHFIVCMWTAARREALAREAALHDAIIVLGCEAAVQTARSCASASGCRVIAGMEVEGIMNVIPMVRFPCDISLQVSSVTRVVPHRSPSSSILAAQTHP